MLYRIEALYTDGSNYKCPVTIERDSDEFPAILKLSPTQEDVPWSDLGIEEDDIQLIVEYGRDREDVEVVSIRNIELME